jgi:hypothetical protein
MIIRGNQRQSRKWRVGSHLMKEAINDHQRQSEAITKAACGLAPDEGGHQ